MTTEKSPNLAEVAISYRTKVKASDRAKITSSRDAFEIFKQLYDVNTVEHHEVFIMLMLNRANRVLGWAKISQGGIAGTVVDVRIVFQHAILANASGIVISHNHPSGETVPSEPDKLITKKMRDGGKLLDVALLDHIIFTPENYYSFSDEGLI